MIKTSWLRAALIAALLLGAPAGAWAQSCPANADELSRSVVGNKLVLKCACKPGFVTHERRCITIDDAAMGFYVSQEDVARLLYPGYPGFMDGDDLRKAADDGRWALPTRLFGRLAAFMGEGGQLSSMEVMIEMVGKGVSNNPAVEAARKRLEERRRSEQQLFMLLRPELRRTMWELGIGHMPNKGKADFVFGVTAFRLGDYATALRLLTAAQASVPGDRSLDDALVIVRMAQRSEWEKKHPQEARILYARAFRSAGAQAASQLGLQLLASGDYAGGEIALRESAQRLRRLNGYAMEIELNGRLADRAKEERAAGKRSMVDKPGERPFDRLTKAELMLTACEYGQKDWSRSLHFLEIAMVADPDNPRIGQAYRELKEIAAGAK